MKTNGGQVQTVSIIATISELAHNQRSAITSDHQPDKVPPLQELRYPLHLPSLPAPPSPPPGPRSHPPPPPLNPRSPKMTVPATMMVPRTAAAASSTPHQTVNGHTMTKLERLNVSAIVRPNFDELSNGLVKSEYMNSTNVRRMEEGERRRRRVKKTGMARSGGRGQGQTPDWIRDIFGIAKKGNLEQLVSNFIK